MKSFRKGYYVILFLCPLVPLILAIVTSELIRVPEGVTPILFIGSFAILGIQLHSFKCPSCKNKVKPKLFLEKKCPNCGVEWK